MNCTNCGKELGHEVKFCDGCGSPVVSEQNSHQAQAQPESAQPAQTAQSAQSAQTAQPAQTAQSAPVNQEAQENKVIFILYYILFFLPLVSCPGSKTGRFHANQGLILLITSVVGQIAVTILSTILLSISLALWRFTSLIGSVWWIAVLALMIIGMINANKGEQKPLPIIGKFTIIK